MGLEIPNLDRYRFERLMEDALAKLPAFSGDWNDFNASDPGVTITELLAWFADIDSYRFDRVTKAHRRAFLKLVGLKPEPPTPAAVILRFNALANKKIVPAGTLLKGNGLTFKTLLPLKVSGAAIESVATRGYGDEIKVGRMPFYPFGRFLKNGFCFTLTFSKKVPSGTRFYFKVRAMSLKSDGSEALSWRYCSDEAECKKPPSQWKGATAVKDGTCGMRQSGFIELTFDTDALKIAAILEKEQTYENLPLIEAVVPDSVEAVQVEPFKDKKIGTSSGYVNQRFRIEEGLDPESLELRVGQKVWKRVESLFGSDPDDEVYMLEEESVLFGDGGYGKVPPRGADILCSYQKSEGSRGNIGKGATWSFADGSGAFGVENPFDAEGGADARDIQALFDSFEESLGRLDRAVTEKDHETLALATPDTVLARVQAETDKETNHITLTPIPDSEMKKPQPSEETRERVNAFMQERTLLTTKIDVVEPEYAEISIAVSIRSGNFDEAGVRQRVVERLERYLHPLYGGADAKGWTDAKTLYISWLYLELIDVEGVASVDNMMVTLKRANGTLLRKKEGKIEAEKGEIFASGSHFVHVVVPQIEGCGGIL